MMILRVSWLYSGRQHAVHSLLNFFFIFTCILQFAPFVLVKLEQLRKKVCYFIGGNGVVKYQGVWSNVRGVVNQ